MGDTMALAAFIAQMPKAELHLHIEGTLEPEMMLALARRNTVALAWDNVADIRKAYAFDCLQDFLDLYYQGMSVLIDERDFYDLTFAYLQKVHSQNVTHAEIFFDPQGHTGRGISFDTVVQGIVRALEQGHREFGITSRLIMCFLRHLPEEAAFETLKCACRAKDHIHAVGLDSSEAGHPPEKFSRVYGEARAAGFAAVAHAGEEGPPGYVAQALDDLQVARIDHGNRALEDGALVARLVREQTPLTLCPLSNLRLKAIGEMAAHPARTMLQAGLMVTINSDDPSYFGGYINENYLAVQHALNLDRREIETLARNSFAASFMPDAAKQVALDDFARFSERWREAE